MNSDNKRDRILGISATSLPLRSTLHQIAPQGLGTGAVESLTSYFCRLSNSHSCSTHDLAQFVMRNCQTQHWPEYAETSPRPRFIWYERAIAGICDAAQTWSAALAELTAVERLDRLTLLPLQGLIVAKGLMAKQARWCPNCLADDLAQGQPVYFRLSWDISANKVCDQHNTVLIAHCPSCQRSRVRHTSHCVVPGWCCHCGGFLGAAKAKPPDIQTDSSSVALQNIAMSQEMRLLQQRARQIAQLLSVTSALVPPGNRFEPNLEKMHDSLEFLIEKMDFGVAAHFAKRIGIGKPCLHGWRKNKSAITFEGALNVCSFTGMDMASFFEGSTHKWVRGQMLEQLPLELIHPKSVPARQPRVHDWPAIRLKLQAYLKTIKPLSVAKIGQELDIDDRLLYLHANDLVRELAQRYLEYRERHFKAAIARATEEIRQACLALSSQGIGISPSALEPLVPKKTMNAIPNLYTLLSQFAQSMPRQ